MRRVRTGQAKAQESQISVEGARASGSGAAREEAAGDGRPPYQCSRPHTTLRRRASTLACMTGHTSARPDLAPERLQELVEVWGDAAADVLSLLRSLDEDDWQRPTDLPAWDVRAVAAHLAHLESVLAGRPQDEAVLLEATSARTVSSRFTEAGVVARAGWPVERILDELETSLAASR